MGSQQQHLTPRECEQQALASAEEAFKSGRWFLAVGHLDKDNVLQVRKTTCEFPRSAYPELMKLLKRFVDQDQGYPTRSPLPSVDLNRSRNGDSQGGEEKN